MATISFKEWAPDIADLGNPGAIIMKNALPGVTSYKPFSSLVTTTNALVARPRGAIEATDLNENVYQYAGDVDTLYSLSGTTWADVSIGGGYGTGTGGRWEFVRWKEKIIATNFSDNPQAITFGGANFANLTTALRFRHVAVVRDFVVAGYTFDGTDGTVRDRVRWSAINDETDWTPSATTLADFRDLNVGGGIQRIIGGEYGVIVCEGSTFRMSFAGSPTIFQIDETVPGVGALAPGGVVGSGDTIYFPSEHGFVSLVNGAQETFIGAGRVDDFFRKDLDTDYLDRISAVADPESGVVFWAYPGAGNMAGRPNKIIAYDRKLDKWGYAEVELELLWRSGGSSYTLEQLDNISTDIDAMTVTFDSPQYKGSSPLLAAFDTDYTNGNFTGTPYDATFVTREVELNELRKTPLNAFYPVVDGGTVTGRIGYRDLQSEMVAYTPLLVPRPSGRFTKRVNARYHRFEVNVTGDWLHAMGAQVDRTLAPRGQGRNG